MGRIDDIIILISLKVYIIAMAVKKKKEQLLRNKIKL